MPGVELLYRTNIQINIALPGFEQPLGVLWGMPLHVHVVPKKKDVLPSALTAVVFSVHFGVLLPLIRKLVQSENRRHGADRNTGSTINTFHWINVKLRCFGKAGFVFFGMNAVHRAGIHTSGILGPDAGFSNYVCHSLLFVSGSAGIR
jgi:hypothetical protein